MGLIHHQKRHLAAHCLGYEASHAGDSIRGDSVAFFPELRLVFNRIKKSGNTSALLTLNKIAGREDPENSEAPKSQRSIRRTPLRTIVASRDFATLTIVRDPASRVLSAYHNKVGSGLKARHRNLPGFGDASPDAFETFLRHISTTDEPVDPHFWPQARLLIKPAGKFTFIARLENLAREMAPVLKSLGVDPRHAALFAGPHPLEANRPAKITSSNTKVKTVTPRAAEMIFEMYDADYRAFGYEKRLPA